MDPRLPHGRAGDHLLRPRPAQGVPGRARGHRRRHPRRPGGRRHHRGGGQGPRARPTSGQPVPEVVQVASGSQNPLRYRRLVDLVSDWFLEHPLYDHEGQPIVVPDWSFPGRGRVQAQLTRAKTMLERAEKVLTALPLRGTPGRVRRHRRGAPRGGRAGPRLRRAVRRLRRVRGRLRPRPAAGPVGRPDPRGPGPLLLRPPGHRLGPLRRARSTCRRWSSTAGCAPPRAAGSVPTGPTACAARCSPPSASWPPSTWRTRSSPPTWWPPTRGWPPADCPATSGCASWPAPWPRPRRCWPWTARTAATSCASSTAATTTPRSTRSTRTRPRCSAS